MKKTSFRVLSLVLSLVIAFSCVVCASAFEGRYGDTDGKGVVDSTDALAILFHTVGKKPLTGDALIRADVNADTYVNSSDALEVLLFTVGRVDKFKAETTAPPEAPEKEILELYADAVDKMYEIAPFYRLKNVVETVDVSTSGDIELDAEMQASLKEQMQEKTVNKSVYPLGSNGARLNLPRQFSVDDAAKFESVDYELLETGEYKLVIRFKDEINPTKEGLIIKAFGLPDEEEFKASLQNEFADLSASLGGLATISAGDVKYENASVTCVWNPETNEVVSYETVCDMSVSVKFSVKVEIFFVPVEKTLNINMVTRTTNSYTDFRYTEETV